ncbi:MAG: DUF1365 domain-containing protein [Bdellovibrionales bacterium]|nr:DUF1365 domain-containing protein [Bdellovibrionales bacterium]
MSSNVKSAIYLGTVRHRRFRPKRREFRHRVCYFYLDLEEIPRLLARRFVFSDRGPSLFGFRREAYLGPIDRPLDEAVRDRVERETGERPRGPIRLLTQVATFGLAFNPVTFYYCFDAAGERVTHLVAEITNTPWGERHAYVLTADGSTLFEFEKLFHVSPFLGMDYRYRWGFSPPGARLNVHMENRPNEAPSEVAFDATLTLERREWSASAVAGALFRHPLMTAKTLALIYLHAAVIWLRRIPFVDHPRSRGEVHPRPSSGIVRSRKTEPSDSPTTPETSHEKRA